MKIRITHLPILFFFMTSPVIAELKEHIKFMEPMIPFQVCVLNASDTIFANKSFVNLHSKESGDLGEIIWQKVLEECKGHIFSDKTKGKILLAYNGNDQKTIGYIEGSIYAARNYIFIRSLENENSQP